MEQREKKAQGLLKAQTAKKRDSASLSQKMAGS